ncbi:proline-rich receptor-like protein kinase PERK8 [Pollicipes pollicipes]|uniref:proline-rich receptor-like protein kinase PERK8 n=1 Tax=Pollicipes pollicipes TaxID=41117 RepID=UPI001884941B|nr:proline-rich receptor-like protein kinase PERK8 [Pollicipes pollicipes]
MDPAERARLVREAIQEYEVREMQEKALQIAADMVAPPGRRRCLPPPRCSSERSGRYCMVVAPAVRERSPSAAPPAAPAGQPSKPRLLMQLRSPSPSDSASREGPPASSEEHVMPLTTVSVKLESPEPAACQQVPLTMSWVTTGRIEPAQHQRTPPPRVLGRQKLAEPARRQQTPPATVSVKVEPDEKDSADEGIVTMWPFVQVVDDRTPTSTGKEAEDAASPPPPCTVPVKISPPVSQPRKKVVYMRLQPAPATQDATGPTRVNGRCRCRS